MDGHAHVFARASRDPEGFPRVVVAHSRKVQKGEDVDVARVDGAWRCHSLRSSSDRSRDDVVEFAMFGLFDGHGGKACATHCAERFYPELLIALDADFASDADDLDVEDEFERRLPEALKRAFKAVDEDFLSRDVHSGATATIAVVRERCVVVAAVGDSLAILDLGPGFPAIRLSREHRLDTLESERKRIEDAGGEVRPTEYEDGPNGERVGVGPLRVWPGGLAVSRSIGDRDGKRGGVISEPEVCVCVLPDRFHSARIVLASDGLWDAATPKQAAACGSKMNTQNAAAALNKLAQKQKDNRDDITVMVIDLLRDESMSTPFAVKPGAGDEKPVLHWPFSKNTHEPLPLPSERRAARQKKRDEATALAAAIETARRAAELETETLLKAREAAARCLAEAEADQGEWEAVGKVHDIKEPEAEKTQKEEPRVSLNARTKKIHQSKSTAKQRKQDAGAPRLPDVGALNLGSAPEATDRQASAVETARNPKKQNKKERSTRSPVEDEEKRAKKLVQPVQTVQPVARVPDVRMPPVPRTIPQSQPMFVMPHGAPRGSPPMMLVHPGVPLPPGLPPMIPNMHGLPPMLYMRPPPPGFSLSHSIPAPVMGHAMPPLQVMRTASPPAPPFLPSMNASSLNWQQQQIAAVPQSMIAPPTPTRNAEQPKRTASAAPDRAATSKPKRKGKMERARERAARLASEGLPAL